MSIRTLPLRELLSRHTAPAAEELTRREGEALRCLACGHRCRLRPGRHGVCQVRFNDAGTLRVPFGYVSSLAVDPLEKKPFFHAYPGRAALSFGMFGCDFHCAYCQNWVTSQTLRDDRALAEPHFVEPQRIVQLALEHDCRAITSTYNEPLITSEWAAAIFKLARQHGLAGSYVSNGNATPEVLAYLRPYVDLFKIDLKAFQDRTYRRLGGTLANVLNTISRAWRMGFWVEVVTLVVPGLNDSDGELRDIARFLVEVSPDLPWHVTAFHPDYQMTAPPRTTAAGLRRAHEIGRAAGLKFVYAGNLPGLVGELENTNCPACGATLIERRGFQVLRNRMKAANCPDCGALVAGVWEANPPASSDDGDRPRPVRG